MSVMVSQITDNLMVFQQFFKAINKENTKWLHYLPIVKAIQFVDPKDQQYRQRSNATKRHRSQGPVSI